MGDVSIESVRVGCGAQDIATSRFFSDLNKGVYDRNALKLFFIDYFQIVQTAYRAPATAVVTLPSSEVKLVKYMMRFLETEAGGDVPHLQMYYNWVEEVGLSPKDLLAGAPGPQASSFTKTMMAFYESGDPITILAAQLATEDCASILISSMSDAFLAMPFSVRAKSYLFAHLMLENDETGHSAWARDALLSHPSFAAEEARVVQVARSVALAFKGLFDGFASGRSGAEPVGALTASE